MQTSAFTASQSWDSGSDPSAPCDPSVVGDPSVVPHPSVGGGPSVPGDPSIVADPSRVAGDFPHPAAANRIVPANAIAAILSAPSTPESLTARPPPLQPTFVGAERRRGNLGELRYFGSGGDRMKGELMITGRCSSG